MNAWKRYLELHWQFFLYSLKRELEFKANFIGTFVVNMIWYGSQLLLFELIYHHVDRIGTFERGHMYVFLFTVFLTHSIYEYFFSTNTQKIARYVTEGELDFLILKPMNSQFLVSCRYLSVSTISNIIFNYAIIFYLMHHHGFPIEPVRVLTYTALAFNGAMILYILDFTMSMMNLWFRKFSHGRWFVFEIIKLSHKPDVIYPGLMRRILLISPPLMVISSVPTRVLVLGLSPLWVFPCLALTVGLLGLTHLGWNASLRQYESASS